MSAGKGWSMAIHCFLWHTLTFTSTFLNGFSSVTRYALLLCWPGWFMRRPNGDSQSPQLSTEGWNKLGHDPSTPNNVHESLAIIDQQMQMQTEGFGCWPFRFGWKGTAVFSRPRIATFVPALSFHMTKTKRIACSGQSEDGKNLIWYLHHRRCCRRKRRHYLIQIRLHGVTARVAQNTWWVGSKGTSDVGVLGKLHVVALVLGGQIAVHVNWPRDLARLVGTQPHVATTCYKTSIVSSRRSTRKDALSYFENCWAGWLCFLSRTLKRSTQMMATISTIRGLTTIKIFNVAPWTRTTTTATHYKHQPGTNNKQPGNRTTNDSHAWKRWN